MYKAFSHEFYPDMKVFKNNVDYGTKVMTLACRVTNGKRFKSMTKKDREKAAEVIDTFQKQLTVFKEGILNPKPKQP